jgi:hypothetical protein
MRQSRMSDGAKIETQGFARTSILLKEVLTTMKKRTLAAIAAVVAVVAVVPFFPARAFAARDFTAASETVQSDDEAGKAWAEHIAQSAGAVTETEKIRAVYDWYTGNMEYDHDLADRLRRLPADERASHMPGQDYLSVLASVTDYVTGKSKAKPKSLCGGYVHGVAGSLRSLGIPVKIEIGRIPRTAKKGETYFDASGRKRTSQGKGETLHQYYNGRWVEIRDLHARLSIRDGARERWISADPTFDSIEGGHAYFDMSAERAAKRWTPLYTSSERAP